VDEVNKTIPITYKIKDLEGEPILGSFYKEELSKTKFLTFQMEAKYIIEYSDFPGQKVLSKINENEKKITDTLTRTRLVQQGYQSELKTFFKPVTDEINKLPLQDKLTTINNQIEKLKQAETTNESLSKLRDK